MGLFEKPEKDKKPYIKGEKEKRAQVERQVMEYLAIHKFKEASLAVAAYGAEQITPRGIGMDWKHHNPNHDIEMLKTIFERKPKILVHLGIKNDKLETLRIAAAMMLLWGAANAKKWLPADFEIDSPIEYNVVVRMIAFSGTHQSTLERYRNEGIKYVEVLTPLDSCEFCKKLAGRHFKINEAPELPYEHCTHKMGCRCCFLAIID